MADVGLTGEGYFLPSEFLSDDFFTESDEENPKASVMGTSPQSTLSGVVNMSFSSSGSPKGHSQVPSTPFTTSRDSALDLLYAAVGQVERLKLNDEFPSKNRTEMGIFYPNQELIKQQLQVARFYQLRRQQMMKMHQQYAAFNAAWERERQRRIRANAVSNIMSAAEWPALQGQQNQHGSGMPSVLLSGRHRQSNGTGVFLPRRMGTPVESTKKALPARVVRDETLNVEKMPGCFVREDKDALMGRGDLRRNQHRRSLDARLPPEWTY